MRLFDGWKWSTALLWCDLTCSQPPSLESHRVFWTSAATEETTWLKNQHLGSSLIWNGVLMSQCTNTHTVAHCSLISCDEAAQNQWQADAAACVDTLPGVAVYCRPRRGGELTVYIFQSFQSLFFQKKKLNVRLCQKTASTDNVARLSPQNNRLIKPKQFGITKNKPWKCTRCVVVHFLFYRDQEKTTKFQHECNSCFSLCVLESEADWLNLM